MRNKRFLLLLFLVMLLPSVGLAHHKFHKWWQQPKKDPLPELVVFDELSTKRAVCKEVHVRHRRVVYKQRTKFANNPTLSAAAVQGVLFFEPFEIFAIQGEGVSSIGFLFNEATLRKGSFGPYFHTTGTAFVNGEIEVPVKMSGSIIKDKWNYRLKARVFGNLCEIKANHGSYQASWSHKKKKKSSHKPLKVCKLVKLNLKGFGTEQELEPEPEPEPGPGPEPEPGPI